MRHLHVLINLKQQKGEKMTVHNSFSIKAFGEYHFNWKSDRIGKTINQDFFNYTAEIEREKIGEFHKQLGEFDDDMWEVVEAYSREIEISEEKIWECENWEMLWIKEKPRPKM